MNSTIKIKIFKRIGFIITLMVSLSMIGIYVIPNSILSFFNEIFFIVIMPIFLSSLVVFINAQKVYRIVISILILILAFGFDIYAFKDMFIDIPYVITSKYQCTEGFVEYMDISGGRIPKQRFQINYIRFDINKNYIQILKDEKYRVSYLPNSKYIIKIEKL